MALNLIFEVARQKSAVLFFTDIYSKISQKISENLQMASFALLFFFLQVFELNKKLDELSLKHPTLDIDLLDKGLTDNDLDL